MAGGELGVPRGVSGIEVIGKGIIITPSSASWLGWTHRALGIPSGSKSRLGGIMAPAKHSARGLESLSGCGRVGSTQKREEKLKSRRISAKTSPVWEDRADGRGRHRLVAGASPQGLAWHLGALP